MANVVATYKNTHLLATSGMMGVALHTTPPDKFLTLINLTNGHELARYPQPITATQLSAIALNPDHQSVVYGQNRLLETRHNTSEYTLTRWDTQTQTTQTHILTHAISSVAWYDSRKCLFAMNNQCFLWDTITPSSANFTYIGEGGHKLAIHSAMLALCGGRTIRIINPMTQSILFDIQLDSVLSGFGNCFSPDGALFAITLRKNLNEVILWDIQQNQPKTILKTHHMVTAIAWSPDSSQLLIAQHQAGTTSLSIWDIASQKEIRHLADVQGRVLQLIWIGNTILAGNDDLFPEVMPQIWMWRI